MGCVTRAPHGGRPSDRRSHATRQRAGILATPSHSLYQRWLAEPEAFGLTARQADGPVEYAFARVQAAETGTTWGRSGEVAVLETVSVLPAFRGVGVGETLLSAVRVSARLTQEDRFGQAFDRAMAFELIATAWRLSEHARARVFRARMAGTPSALPAVPHTGRFPGRVHHRAA